MQLNLRNSLDEIILKRKGAELRDINGTDAMACWRNLGRVQVSGQLGNGKWEVAQVGAEGFVNVRETITRKEEDS